MVAMSRLIIFLLIAVRSVNGQVNLVCSDVFDHFEDRPDGILYSSMTDMITLSCNYSFEAYDNMTFTVSWNIEDNPVCVHEYDEVNQTFSGLWSGQTGVASWDWEAAAGSSLVHVPISTLVSGSVKIDLFNISLVTFIENEWNTTTFHVNSSTTSFDLTITEAETECSEPITYDVTWLKVHDMCLMVNTMVGGEMVECSETSMTNTTCMKSCSATATYDGSDIVIEAMPGDKLKTIVEENGLMDKVMLMSEKATRCMEVDGANDTDPSTTVSSATSNPGASESNAYTTTTSVFVGSTMTYSTATASTAASASISSTARPSATKGKGDKGGSAGNVSDNKKKSTSKKDKGMSAWAIALIVVGVAVLGAVGAAGFMAHQKSQQGASASASSAKPEGTPAAAEAGGSASAADGLSKKASTTSAANGNESATAVAAGGAAAASASTTGASTGASDTGSVKGSVRQNSTASRQNSVSQVSQNDSIKPDDAPQPSSSSSGMSATSVDPPEEAK